MIRADGVLLNPEFAARALVLQREWDARQWKFASANPLAGWPQLPARMPLGARPIHSESPTASPQPWPSLLIGRPQSRNARSPSDEIRGGLHGTGIERLDCGLS
jgi:hypothetical protein